MKKNIVQYTFVTLVTALLLASCPSAVSHKGSGIVSVSFGPTSRNVLYAPPFPAFSSATVSVSGDDMTTVSASLVDGKAVLEVPEGKNRLVTVDAVPDWIASKTADPDKYFTILAKRYGGSTTVDVKVGETVTAAVQLGMTESRLLLPLPNGGYTNIAIADSIDSLYPIGTFVGDFAPGSAAWTIDGYGRPYVVDDFNYIYRFNDPLSFNPPVNPDVEIEAAAPPLGVYPRALAIDDLKGRLYFLNGDGEHGYFDGATESLVLFEGSSLSNYWIEYYCIAADDEGAIYVPAVDSLSSISYILKCTVGEAYGGSDPYSADVTIADSISYEAAGLTYIDGVDPYPLSISHMVVVDGTLYVAAGEGALDPPFLVSRGKIAAVSTDFKSVQTVGWCGDDQSLPVPGKENEQFYGPFQFIGLAPKKLYVSDGGYNEEFTTVSRVVEVSLSPLAITKVASLPVGMSFIEY